MGYDAVLLNTAIAKAGDPVKMAAAFARAVEAGTARLRGGSDRAARHGLALDAGRRHALLQDRSRVLIDPRSVEPGLDQPRSLLSHRPRHGLARPPAAARHQARSASHQGHSRRASSAPRSKRRSRSAPPMTATLVVNDYWREAIEAGARLRASRPGGLGGRRPLRHQGRGDQDRRQHAQSRGAGRRACRRGRLCRARSDLRHHAESDAVAAARASPSRRMAVASSAARWWRLAASRSTARRSCLPRAPIPSPSSPTL